MRTSQLKLGVSAAASWAWGTSLIVGMQIAREKGLAAWAIWAIANSLTLLVFGELARSGFLGRHVFGLRWIKYLALGIQAICLVVQMNIIYTVLGDMGLAPQYAYLAACGIGWAFTLLMYRHGLPTSIWTDCWQWAIAVAAILVIMGTGAWCSVPLTVFPDSTSDDILWALWSACILLAGPVGDVQHWQRAEAAGTGNAYTIGAGLFAVYMMLIGAMACLQFNFAMNCVLLIAVLCVTTSTIDSIAVALHEASNRLVGTGIALAVCTLWGAFASLGILSLWSRAGVYRVLFALLIIGIAYSLKRKNNDVPDT